jgi:hypothetical protein
VLGTFHANSPEAVFERVVYDLGIPPRSFNATDVIVITSFTRPSGVQRQIRRVTQISELQKRGGHEGVFQDLMVYDESRDAIIETEVFNHNSEVIGAIAGAWGITMEQAIQNIVARATIRKIIVDYSHKYNNLHVLSAEWVCKSNNKFWGLIEQHFDKRGEVNYKLLVDQWHKWFRRSVEYA